MENKGYTLKLETKCGSMILDNLDEYVFAKKYLYYSKLPNLDAEKKDEGSVGRVPRGIVNKAFRLLKGSSKWVEIKMKQFKE